MKNLFFVKGAKNILLPEDDNFTNTLKYGDYTLVINEDFIIYSATSSVDVGNYNYQIKGIGNYTGTITKQFTIVANLTAIRLRIFQTKTLLYLV